MRTLTRPEAIEGIRGALLTMVDDEHSACQVAAENNIFCRGFRQYSDAELAERYDWLSKRASNREQLEDLANRWQLARQLVQDEELACDVQCVERDTCHGWDTHSDEALAKYYSQLFGEEVQVFTPSVVHIGEAHT